MTKTKAKRPAQRTPQQETFLGLPGSLRWPGWAAIGRNVWDSTPNAKAFPPKVWGYGWSLNFAYPLIRTKPLAQRIGMFILSLTVLVLLVYVLIVLGLLAYWGIDSLLNPATPQTLEFILDANGTLQPV